MQTTTMDYSDGDLDNWAFPIDRSVMKAWVKTLRTTGGLMAGFVDDKDNLAINYSSRLLARYPRNNVPRRLRRSKL